MMITRSVLGSRFSIISLLAIATFIACTDDAYRLGGTGGSSDSAGTGDGSAGSPNANTGGEADSEAAAGTSASLTDDEGSAGDEQNSESATGGSGTADDKQGSAGSTAEQSTDTNSTCQVLFPTTPTYYPWDTDSPCPKNAPQATDSDRVCERSLVGTRCTYPMPESPDVLELWSCYLEGTLNGEETPGSESNWEQSDLLLCNRTGANCPIDDGDAIALDPGSGACQSSPSACTVDFDVTAQGALDRTMSDLLGECAASENVGCETATLTVRFESACVKDFVAAPAVLAPCVRAALESPKYARLSCALGLTCSHAEVGSCMR